MALLCIISTTKNKMVINTKEASLLFHTHIRQKIIKI